MSFFLVMSGNNNNGNGSSVLYSGTNKQGNEYRVYDNGGYRYKNYNSGNFSFISASFLYLVASSLNLKQTFLGQCEASQSGYS